MIGTGVEGWGRRPPWTGGRERGGERETPADFFQGKVRFIGHDSPYKLLLAGSLHTRTQAEERESSMRPAHTETCGKRTELLRPRPGRAERSRMECRIV